MSLLSFLLLLALLSCFISLLGKIAGKCKIPIGLGSKNRLPPGPPGLPILGNLLMFGRNPHQTFLNLANVYGPIIYLRLGVVPNIIISSPQSAEQILKIHDRAFASRPSSEAQIYMAYAGHGVVLAPFGPYWRTVRKLCTMSLLSPAKVHLFESVRRDEVAHLVQSLKEAANARATANLAAAMTRFTTNMMFRMMFGRRCMDGGLDEKRFIGLIQEILDLHGAFNWADYIPFIGLFDIQGLRRRMKDCGKRFDEICEKIVKEQVVDNGSRQQTDFVNVMLSDADFQACSGNVKAMVADMMLGGVETSADAIEWALSELIKYPRIMKKVRDEIRQVVGMDRMVEESDLPKFEYLDMVIKETFRFHPAAALLLPHESIEDCTVNGFHIPKKSRVLINIYAIGRDPTVWPNPNEFLPERFVGNNMDIKGHNFELIPFGSGRRGCPGIQLGLTVVQLVLAQMVHCFDWELPNGMLPSEIDMTEEYGITLRRANPLLAIPIYRL